MENKNLEKSRKVIKNLGFNFGIDLITVIVFVILTPIILDFIDVELYGIWVILFSFITYLAILNLGTGSAVIKYTSKYYTEKNPTELNKSIHSILFIIFFVGLIGALLIIFLLFPMLIYMYEISASYYQMIYIISIILACYFFINSITNVYSNVLVGFQRFDLILYFNILRTCIYFFGSLIVLNLGWSLTGLVSIQLLSTILTLFLSIRYIRKIFPEFKIIPRQFDWKNAKMLYKFSAFAFISDFFLLMLVTFDKMYIGLVFSVSLVTSYSIATKIMDSSFGSVGKIHRVLFPLSSELESERNLEKTKELQIRGLKYISILIFPLALCLILFSRNFINIWLGIEFEITGQLIIVFNLSYIFQVLGVLSSSI